MNQVTEAFEVLFNWATWTGASGFGVRLVEHLWYTLAAVGIALVIALPIGLAIGHFHRFLNLTVATTGMIRALPTLGLLTLVALSTGLGLIAPMVALVTLAIPSILAGAYSGVESVDGRVVDAARAQGMSGWQVLYSVEVPLGMPLLIGGIRTATVQVAGTAILAAYVGAGGLGAPLFLGLRTYDYPLLLAASLVVIALAILLDICFEIIVRLIRKLPGMS